MTVAVADKAVQPWRQNYNETGVILLKGRGSPNRCFLHVTGKKLCHIVSRGTGNDRLGQVLSTW